MEPPIEPPDPCHHDVRGSCEECQDEQSYAEDTLAEWQMERRRLGE